MRPVFFVRPIAAVVKKAVVVVVGLVAGLTTCLA
jgi:hypothetical protein